MKIGIALLALMLSACGCDYENASGQCMDRDAYIKMVAHDAAVNALIDMMNYCSANPLAGQCKAFRRD